MTLISAQNVSVMFDGRTALSDVSLVISLNEIVTIVGPNGAGKSSLVRLLVGALEPDKGKIVRCDDLKIGYVPQKIAIDHSMPMSVARFLKLQKGYSPKAIEKTKIEPLLKKQILTLSGGELKRVLLTYALSADPDILILDEPTAGLDQPAILAFYQLVEDLRNRLGIAVLLVSHDLNVVMRASDRVICLNTHICCQGHPKDVSDSPEFRAMFGAQAPVAVYEHHHTHSHDSELCLHGEEPQ